ncbi:anthrax toxin receptor-like [Maniola jurtina]|uniref:anthrax toxin receptor-like n=1 Tax=Maniola jurtina TaxID=191418 RepID=UPI001E686D73|nr:anthrax toxin receptor-like [Maniola jurtina]
MNNSKVIFGVILLVCIIQSLDCARVRRGAPEEEPKKEPKPVKEPEPKEPEPKEPEPKEPNPPKGGGGEDGAGGSSGIPLLGALKLKELFGKLSLIFKKVVPLE